MTAPTTAGAVDLDRVDLFRPDFLACGDPRAVWAAMRARSPLHRQVLPDGRSFWSVTRYPDVCRVLGDAKAFTSERGSLLAQLGSHDPASGRMMPVTDPPRHGELRRPLARLFRPEVLALLEEDVRAVVREVLASVTTSTEWDLAARMQALPAGIAGIFLQLPRRDLAELLSWSNAAAAPHEPTYRLASGPAATSAVAHHQLFAYFAGRCAERGTLPAAPGHDPVAILARMQEAEVGRLTAEEAVLNCYSLLIGATATTPHTVTGTVLALLDHPDQLAAVRADPRLIPSLVEEGLRWTSPAASFLRYAVHDVELSGGLVRAGEAVVAWVGSANRDATVFAEPDRFDVARDPNRHIAFGHGPHYCLGAPLARVTLRVFFEEALGVLDRFEPAGTPVRLASNFLAGYTRAPIRTRGDGVAVSRADLKQGVDRH